MFIQYVAKEHGSNQNDIPKTLQMKKVDLRLITVFYEELWIIGHFIGSALV